jgi:putative Holliday junction resolvase
VSTETGSDLILAFDFGERRIGVATGNRLTGTASPAGLVACHDGEPQWSEIDRIFSQWAPGAFVTGRPPTGNDRLMEGITNFVHALELRYKLPVYLVDESLTSQAAEAALIRERRDGIRKKRVKRGDVDQIAACIIAQKWLAEIYRND